MKYIFHTSKEMLSVAKEENITLSEVCLRKETNLTNKTENEIKKILKSRLKVMKNSIDRGLEKERVTMGKMAGKNAITMKKFLKKNGFSDMTMSETAIKASMYAIANNENNACMGCIVACPTAGASGVLPAVLFATQEQFGFDEETLVEGFLVASGIGSVIAQNATLSGAKGGCQAEIGAASAMAAAALTHMRGGSPDQCLHAAALSLKNMLGLACDPIGGMVEVPCIKRNAFGSQYALIASDLAIIGIESYVPFDEVVEALKNIGNLMSTKIRETARGGLAISATGKRTSEKLGIKIEAND